jgi:methylated-DNA-protein-cysteine methyltransferase-like protein
MADEGRYKLVWSKVVLIPPGKVSRYGQIAELAGIPRGARMIGRALGRAPRELNVPWHRVLNAKGQISLPPGSRSAARQKELLQDEGVVVSSGKVDMSLYNWEPSVDELFWGPPLDFENTPAAPPD